MDFLLFSIFLIFNLLLLITGITRKNLFLGIFAGIFFIILGAFTLQDGIVITYVTATTYKDTFIGFMGFSLFILGLASIFISIFTSFKKESVTDDTKPPMVVNE
jgi:hypothetical protein